VICAVGGERGGGELAKNLEVLKAISTFGYEANEDIFAIARAGSNVYRALRSTNSELASVSRAVRITVSRETLSPSSHSKRD
jgi:hypothetical protein